MCLRGTLGHPQWHVITLVSQNKSAFLDKSHQFFCLNSVWNVLNRLAQMKKEIVVPIFLSFPV